MIRCFTIPMPGRPLLLMVTSGRNGFSLGWGMRPKPGSVKLYGLGVVSDPLPGLEFQEVRQPSTMSDGWHNLDQPPVENVACMRPIHTYEPGERDTELHKTHCGQGRECNCKSLAQCPYSHTIHGEPTFEVTKTVTIPESDWIREDYFPTGHLHEDPPLLREMFDRGLIYAANRMLHMWGFAIGVDVTEDGRLNNFCIFKTSDPMGITFDEEMEQAGRTKLFPERVEPEREHPNFETLMTPEMAEREIKRQRDETHDGLDRRYTCANCDRPYVEHGMVDGGRTNTEQWCPSQPTTWKRKPPEQERPGRCADGYCASQPPCTKGQCARAKVCSIPDCGCTGYEHP